MRPIMSIMLTTRWVVVVCALCGCKCCSYVTYRHLSRTKPPTGTPLTPPGGCACPSLIHERFLFYSSVVGAAQNAPHLSGPQRVAQATSSICRCPHDSWATCKVLILRGEVRPKGWDIALGHVGPPPDSLGVLINKYRCLGHLMALSATCTCMYLTNAH